MFLLFYCYYGFNLLIIKYLRMITTNIFMTTKRKKSYSDNLLHPLQGICNTVTTYL